jgi:RecB family exonuclease/inactivated superfamily I helicase
MSISRTFLDWRNPALPAAAEYLLKRYARDGVLDLDRVAVVLPTSKAGRRLATLLIDAADAGELTLLPPLIATLGELPELLYESKQPFASPLVQQFAWIAALRGADQESLRSIVPRLPENDDTAAWLALAELLSDQHRELAAEGLDFGHVMQQDGKLDKFVERDRWRTLAELQQQYLAQLDQHGLWDKQTARLFAIKERECRTDRDIVLVATVDMNRVVKQMLDQVRNRVAALVHAPAELADTFDPYGCLMPSEWEAATIELAEDRIHVAEKAADQADAVARIIAGYGGRFAADEIAIGAPDDRLAPHIERQLTECGLATRWAVGRPVAETGPLRLLRAVAHCLGGRRFSELAALLRHPDIERWLAAQGVEPVWINQLDDYFARHLQPELGDFLGEKTHYAALAAAHAAIRSLIAPLEAGRTLRLSQWAERLADLLLAVYGAVEVDRAKDDDLQLIAACHQIRTALVEHHAAPEALSPRITAAEAIDMLLGELSAAAIAPPRDVGQIEMLGWLELPLDEAPALIVTAMNEGFVPKSLTSDHFLPDRLRRQLGLVDNVRRYARDCYALQVLLATRKELDLVVGRRDSRGDPLAPSRLLLATDAAALPRRAKRLFDPPGAKQAKRPLAGALTAGREKSAIEVPLPLPLPEPLDKVSVSGLSSYLACPYRFYLAHVLKLESVDDTAEELGAGDFGTLVHEALKRFGRNEIRHSTSVDEIRDFLTTALTDYVAQRYGGEHLPAVDIQVAQAAARLHAFAPWQAERAAAGWEIIFSETEEASRYCVSVDGCPMTIEGRIDRVDRHRETGESVIFDYKTSDAGKGPDKIHRKAGEWRNLQLPLYRKMGAVTLGLKLPIGLGYIILPKDTTNIKALMAEWTDDDFAEADTVIEEVLLAIKNQVFWPPNYRLEYASEFAAICQDDVLERIVPNSPAENVRP